MKYFSVFLSLLCMLIVAATATEARETKWQTFGAEVKTRLIGTHPVAGDPERVWIAWEAVLEKGWKTYWRSPGDAGLPVIVKVNDTPVELAYPLPTRFTVLGIESLGYENRVIIPFQIDRKLLDSGATLDVSFMVCKDICIPYESTTELPVPRVLDYDMTIQEWLTKVPEKQAFNAMQPLSITDQRVTGPKGKQRVVIEMTGIVDSSKADAFVEGPDGVHFDAPMITNKGLVYRLVLKARGLDVPDLRGKPLRITVSNGAGKAVDITLN